MTFSVDIITDQRDFARCRDDWDRLVERDPTADLHQTHEWLSSWLEAFWPGRPLTLGIVKNGSGAAAGAILLRDVEGELWCPGCLVAPVNDHSARGQFLRASSDDDLTLALLDHLRATVPDLRIALKTVKADSWIAHELPRLAHRYGLSSVLLEVSGSPYVDLEGGQAAYERTRSAKFRHEMRRKRRRIAEAGSLRFETVTAAADCDRALAAVMDIERSSWKEHLGTAFTSEERLADFYANLAHRCARRGWLRLHLLYLDGAPIAHIYGIVFRGVYYAIKTSYRSDHARHSPGTVLFGLALDDAFAQGYARLELLGDGERWKQEMATGSEPQVHLCMFPRGRPQCEMCRLVRGHAKPFLKRHLPFLARGKHGVDEP